MLLLEGEEGRGVGRNCLNKFLFETLSKPCPKNCPKSKPKKPWWSVGGFVVGQEGGSEQSMGGICREEG